MLPETLLLADHGQCNALRCRISGDALYVQVTEPNTVFRSGKGALCHKDLSSAFPGISFSSVAALAVSRRELMDDGPYYVLGNGDAGMPVQLDGKFQTVEETSVDCLFETCLLMSGRLAAVPSSPPKVHPLQMDRATNSENTRCSPSHTPSYTNVAGRNHPGI